MAEVKLFDASVKARESWTSDPGQFNFSSKYANLSVIVIDEPILDTLTDVSTTETIYPKSGQVLWKVLGIGVILLFALRNLKRSPTQTKLPPN